MTSAMNDCMLKEYENAYCTHTNYFMITFIVLGVIISLVIFVVLLFFVRQVITDLCHWWRKPAGCDGAEYEFNQVGKTERGVSTLGRTTEDRQ
jgi:hypothetical protein